MKAEDIKALDTIAEVFHPCSRPRHFTDHEHCVECAEHDQTLLLKNVNTLSIDDVGNVGWDPICFVSTDGFLYYLPALARLCLDDPTYNHGWYGNQFFWHLISNGPQNARYLASTPEQQRAVVTFIEYVIESRRELLDEYFAADDALNALQIWKGKEVPQYVAP
jgi:hypothetical protein